MSGRRHKKAFPPEEDPGLIARVRAAMRQLGWLVPTDEEQVAQAQAQLPAPGPLPEALQDPGAVFLRGPTGLAGPAPLTPTSDTPAAEQLARAAREGGRIGPEIERRMQADRQAARRDLDQRRHDPGREGTHGPDDR